MQLLLKSIFDFLMTIVDWIFSLIPDLNFGLLSFDFVTPIADFWGYIDSFVSLDMLIACIAVVIIVDNISLLTRLIRFILSKFALG